MLGLSNCQLREACNQFVWMSVEADEGGHLLSPEVAEEHEDE